MTLEVYNYPYYVSGPSSVGAAWGVDSATAGSLVRFCMETTSNWRAPAHRSMYAPSLGQGESLLMNVYDPAPRDESPAIEPSRVIAGRPLLDALIEGKLQRDGGRNDTAEAVRGIRKWLCVAATEVLQRHINEFSSKIPLDEIAKICETRQTTSYTISGRIAQELQTVIPKSALLALPILRFDDDEWIWHVVRKCIDNVALRFGSVVEKIELYPDRAVICFDHDNYRECDAYHAHFKIKTAVYKSANVDLIAKDIPLYADREDKRINPLDFYKRYWKSYADAGVLYRHQLRQHDPALVHAIYMYCKRHPENEADRFLPPPRTELTDEVAAGLGTLSDAARVVRTLAQRQRRHRTSTLAALTVE